MQSKHFLFREINIRALFIADEKNTIFNFLLILIISGINYLYKRKINIKKSVNNMLQIYIYIYKLYDKGICVEGKVMVG